MYMSQAEVNIKTKFVDIRCTFEYKNHEELVILTSKLIKNDIHKLYKQTFELYGGHYKDIVNKMELQKKDHEIEILKMRNEMIELKKDLEISTIRIKMIDLKNKLSKK
jgi:hypothetical protein